MKLANRLSLRLKLVLVFALAITIVLAAIGFFLYLRTKANLDAAIDSALLARARDLAALVELAPSPATLQGRDREFEVLRPDGSIIAASPSLHRQRLLTPQETVLALRRPLLLDRKESSRLYALPIKRPPRRIVVVASSLRQREHALEGLVRALLIGGPLALLAAAAAAYALAARALHAVESMRLRAEGVSRANPHARLPLPAAHDEIHRLGVTLNAMLERLERGAERERRFVADASHELRTPLAILKTELELARADPTPSTLRAAVDSALEEVERLSRLTDTLLVLARADEGAAEHHAGTVDMSELAQRVVERHRAEAARAGRPLQLSASPPALVCGDPARLEQALDNMLTNAIRHASGEIEVAIERALNTVELHVRDRGTGFPDDFLDRALDRFSRPRGNPPSGGTGLGLSIVKTIAETHGGAAGVVNRADGGADVWLALPIAD